MGHMNAGDRNSAIVQLGHAILQKRDYAHAYNNRGNLLLQVGNNFDALLNYDAAIKYLPDSWESHNNRGAALADMGQYDEAEASYRKAIEIKPDFEHAWTNLGNVLKLLDRTQEAREAYERAIEINKDYVDAHLNLSFTCLEMGDYATGWREYEWRWKSGQLPVRALPLKPWNGEPIPANEGLLLYAEQGLGDALQFCRYAPIVKANWGCKVYVETRGALQRLMSKGFPGIDGAITLGDKIPEDVKWYAPLMTCPLIFGHGPEDCPAPRQYLFANDNGMVEVFGRELAKLPPGLRVGICWAGMHRPGQPGAAAVDKRRSTTLGSLAALARVPGVVWVSLQKGPPAEQINSPPQGMTIIDCMPDCDDMYDTAAVLQNLDLIITVDTSVLHLAAAMGKPTWVLSRRDACWRWLGDRRDSPWYQTVRHYRQKEQGDWSALAEEVAHDLRGWVMAQQLKANKKSQ
jgi:hypothetical protein